MKVSTSWLKQLHPSLNTPIDELTKRVGAQLGAVDEVIDSGARYRGIVIAFVVSCEKHPDADKLQVCLIDDNHVVEGVERNPDGYVQVVCGAPNVAANQKVAWLPPGTVVPSTIDKDPFTLEAREIRGVKSNGMLASAAELGLSDDHNGLLLLDELSPTGGSFAEHAGLDGYILDIENKMFTHRPDCFGMIGIAREVSGIMQHQFHSPHWYSALRDNAFSANERTLPLKINNQLPEQTPRFMAIAMAGVTSKPSPLWLQARLATAGIRPINSIVDITNYMMMLTGQPLHAYDYDKVKALSADGDAAVIRIRHPQPDESLSLLNGKTISLDQSSIIIATDQSAIGLGGVMGGSTTEVDASTKNIILECANFDMYAIRQTAMHFGIFSDAVTRFTKGQSPLQCDRVLAEAITMVREITGGTVASELCDDEHLTRENRIVKVPAQFINDRLGLTLTAGEMSVLLENVEFGVFESEGLLTITVPFWRTDIGIAEDIVEEVGRLYGYDHLPHVLPGRYTEPASISAELAANQRLRAIMVQAGANEVLTYSFVHGQLLKMMGQDSEQAYHLRNALSPDLQYYRLSLAPSLLDKVYKNQRAGFDDFMLFEIGKVHSKRLVSGDTDIAERSRLAVVISASIKKQKEAYGGAPYYAAKATLRFLLKKLGISSVRFASIESLGDTEWTDTLSAYEPARSAVVLIGDEVIGLLGEPKLNIRRQLKLTPFTAMAELDIKVLMRHSQQQNKYMPLQRFPSIEQDMTLKTDAAVSFETLQQFLVEQCLAISKTHELNYQIIPTDIYRPESGSAIHRTFSIRWWHPDKTLTTEAVNKIMDEIADQAQATINTERI